MIELACRQGETLSGLMTSAVANVGLGSAKHREFAFAFSEMTTAARRHGSVTRKASRLAPPLGPTHLMLCSENLSRNWVTSAVSETAQKFSPFSVQFVSV